MLATAGYPRAAVGVEPDLEPAAGERLALPIVSPGRLAGQIGENGQADGGLAHDGLIASRPG